MIRGLFLMSALAVMVVEPAMVTEPDLLRYAISQGGLLSVVVTLLWYIRQVHAQQLEDKNKHIEDKDEKLQVMIALVSEVKTALTSTLGSIQTLAQSQQSMSNALDKIEDRRVPR